ncbi:hypothetical protein GCM10011576_40030 [Micromonospora parathelypteridis]|uniref:Uncharacterized protein n=1 Tax=Micromonospora parathelypteridis TaxID=1839617 RepID=A0A840W9K1_9ACTN|nr:hypothetical protein [Micromonospora parathelypteridis]GGO21573.1 hypothetical protein GCM10011576_40030 [Micromonospora parathelypteridis]
MSNNISDNGINFASRRRGDTIWGRRGDTIWGRRGDTIWG